MALVLLLTPVFIKFFLSLLLSLILLLEQIPPALALNLWTGIPTPEQLLLVEGSMLSRAPLVKESTIITNNILLKIASLEFPDLKKIFLKIKSLKKTSNFNSIKSDTISSHQLSASFQNINQQIKNYYQNSTELFNKIDLSSLVVGGSSAYEMIRQSLSKAPQDFSTLLAEMPDLGQRLKYRAGLRVGEAARSSQEAFQLFRQLPGALLLEPTEKKIKTFLADKDASHIISYKHGGSSNASNIFWERSQINRARGALNASELDQYLSRLYNGAEALAKNSITVSKLGLQATSIAVLVDVLVEAELHAIDLATEKITINEFLDFIRDAAIHSSMSAAAFYTLTILAISVFPELMPILASPALITTSEVILGSRLAVPVLRLMQSL